MIFSQANVGRAVTVNGKDETISQVAQGGDWFRIESEQNGPVVNDYELEHIQSANSLRVSFDLGKTWVDVAVKQATP